MRYLTNESFARAVIEQMERPEAEGGLPATVSRPLDMDYTMRLAPLVKQSLKSPSEACRVMRFFYMPGEVEVVVDDLLGNTFRGAPEQARFLLTEVDTLFRTIEEWKAESLNRELRSLAEKYNRRFRDVAHLVRIAVAGDSESPALAESLELVGRARSSLRVRSAADKL